MNRLPTLNWVLIKIIAVMAHLIWAGEVGCAFENICSNMWNSWLVVCIWDPKRISDWQWVLDWCYHTQHWKCLYCCISCIFCATHKPQALKRQISYCDEKTLRLGIGNTAKSDEQKKNWKLTSLFFVALCYETMLPIFNLYVFYMSRKFDALE